MSDEIQAIRQIQLEMNAMRARLAELGVERAKLVRALVDQHGVAQTARMLGIGRARIYQIISRNNGPVIT